MAGQNPLWNWTEDEVTAHLATIQGDADKAAFRAHYEQAKRAHFQSAGAVIEEARIEEESRDPSKPKDLLARAKMMQETPRSTKYLYDQGGLSILDTYQQKQLAISNQEFQQWPGVIVGPETMASVHMPGTMSRAEYEKFYNWNEPDTVTRAPMVIYKPKGVVNTMYDPTRRINNVITYEERSLNTMKRRPVHVDQEPSYRALTNEPKFFLSSG